MSLISMGVSSMLYVHGGAFVHSVMFVCTGLNHHCSWCGHAVVVAMGVGGVVFHVITDHMSHVTGGR